MLSRRLLLFVWMAISMAYYVAGVASLRARWFHVERHARLPFDIAKDLRLTDLKAEAKEAGVKEGDVLQTLNGHEFTGDFQVTNYLAHARPGDVMTVNGRAIHLTPREGPVFTIGGYILYLGAILGVPLLGLIVGYWTVAARPEDPNAWLVLLVLTFPETSFGDLAATFWGGAWYVVFGLWNVVINTLAAAGLMWLGLFFPERSRIDAKWPWLKWSLLCTQVYGLAADLWFRYLKSFHAARMPRFLSMEDWKDEIQGSGYVLCIVLFLVAIVDKQRSASTPDARRRLRVLTAGSCLSLGPLLIIFGVLPRLGYQPHNGWLFEVVVPFLALFPLTLAYVLVVQRAMDLRVLLRMGTKYVLAKATLAAVEIAAAAFLILYFDNSVARAAIVLLLLGAFAFRDRLSSYRLQNWLDRRFFRESYNTEIILAELSEHARTFTEKVPLIQTVSRSISDVLHVPQVAVWLRDGAGFQLQNGMGTLALSGNSATVVNLARTNLPAKVYRDRPDEWLIGAGDDERSVLDQVQAELLLPLPGRNRLMGLIALGPKKSEEPYSPTDLRVLQLVASQTGLALEVSELAHSLAGEAARRARSDREIEIAHDVQERLFPQKIPVVHGLSLAGACRPAQGVGGDYYDMIELEDGRLGLAIGDVSGKGVPAALLMASLRACLRTMTLVGRMDLATLMHRMNQLVFEASPVNRYATFFFSIFDPSTRGLIYVNAGHNPPVVVRGPERILLEASGPVVGLLREVSYEERSVTLESGDLLLAYTDGISEALTADEEEWGEERMVCAAQQASPGSAEAALRAVFDAADRFTGNAPQYDDMTLLVVRVS